MRLTLLVTAATVFSVAAAPVSATTSWVAGSRPAPVLAPYVDIGEHAYGLLDRAIADDHLRWFSAGFVIGDKCKPVWDDTDPITARAGALAKARSLGAKVIVSFGGEGGRDLGRSCTDPAKLLAAYRSVVAHVRPAAIDFDIEGAAINEQRSIDRRFEAIRALEAADPTLSVSLTIPVDPAGLDGSGRALLRTAAADHVRVDLVNIMTMDYGGGSRDMGTAAISAARGTLPQLRKIWPSDSYANLGVTPMIGVNDNSRETFTVPDARRVAAFASAHQVGRLAFWAVERDRHCPAVARHAKSTCSSVDASPLAFTRAFLG
jgi:chitinase